MTERARHGFVRIGHGGTLDPLARGIVVIGMGSGCKKLYDMIDSSKVYIAESRLGFSSRTLDCTGSFVAERKTDHITKDSLIGALNTFKGEITQTPPLYSALSMDGKRLYEYAREGLPLPREIPSRKVQIYDQELLSYPDGNTIPDPCLRHYGFRIRDDGTTLLGPSSTPTLIFSTGFRSKRKTDTSKTNPNHVPIPSTPQGLVFHSRIHCSSGTYVRALIADIATHLGTVGHMTDLLRSEQSVFKLGGEATLEMNECEDLEKVNRAIQAGNRL
ncbi:hypothetical protein BGZ65_009632, partial [Modicella reniformis]